MKNIHKATFNKADDIQSNIDKYTVTANEILKKQNIISKYEQKFYL